MQTRVVTLDELERRFESANESFDWLPDYLAELEERNGPVEFRLAEGPVELDTLTLESPWVLVIDGDLEVKGDIDLWTRWQEISLFVVLGELRARNLRFGGSGYCVVSKSIELSGGCFGHHGDQGAELHAPKLKARVVVLDSSTGIWVKDIDAVVFAHETWQLPRSPNAANVLVPELVRNGEVQGVAMWDLMTTGGDPFSVVPPASGG